ncbi:hypothetical protein BJX61DRAFT_495142 [Aspergillus egyptiacus]|nr:hypothetical protein BJX61DRAFT_495142 [Aspergillus egyptiacus]
MAKETLLAYHGIWRDFSQARYHDLVWTLTTAQLLCLMALLAALLAYTQTRWWIITRYVLIKILHPIRLSDTEGPSLENLPQGEALLSLLSKGRRRRAAAASETFISPWFGIVSLFNVLVFLAAGALVPHFLTGGGPGPAIAVARRTEACRGFQEFSPNAVQMAEDYYTQCRLVLEANDTKPCHLTTDVVDRSPDLVAQLQPVKCPFEEEDSCLLNRMPERLRSQFEDNPNLESWENRTSALRMQRLFTRPSDFGLNADRRIMQQHALTCVPLKIARHEVPWGISSQATVYWVGYNEGSYNSSKATKHGWFTNHLEANDFLTQRRYDKDGVLLRTDYGNGPWERENDSRMLYEVAVYPGLANSTRQTELVNIHPGVNITTEGDMLIMMLKHGMEELPGISFMYSPLLESTLLQPGWWPGVPTSYAVACVELYQLCLESSCTDWLGKDDALATLEWGLREDHGEKLASDLLPVYNLMVNASSLRNFLSYQHRSTVVLRSIIKRAPGLWKTLLQRPQWQWEVRAWFELSFLMVKFNLMASIKDEGRGPEEPKAYFSDTEWVCDKLLFQDNHVSNVTVLGLLVAICAALAICMLSAVGEILAFATRQLKQLYRSLFSVLIVLQRNSSQYLRYTTPVGLQGYLDALTGGTRATVLGMYRATSSLTVVTGLSNPGSSRTGGVSLDGIALSDPNRTEHINP